MPAGRAPSHSKVSVLVRLFMVLVDLAVFPYGAKLRITQIVSDSLT